MPENYALCTVANVRDFLQKQAADTGQDAVISTLIDSASWAIIQRYGAFAPAEASSSKDFSYKGGHRLDFFPYFARTVTAVVLDSDQTTTTTLVSTDWALRPRSPLDGVYRWMRLAGHSPTSYLREANVTVTGTWGFSAIPNPVRQATVITVAEWLRKDVQAFSTTYSIDRDRLDIPEAIPRAALRLLLPYQHERQG